MFVVRFSILLDMGGKDGMTVELGLEVDEGLEDVEVCGLEDIFERNFVR